MRYRKPKRLTLEVKIELIIKAVVAIAALITAISNLLK